jgi:uncharacterized protein (TIGR03382 family)
MPAWLLVGMLHGPPALANGQSTHVWITQHAIAHLPEGELRELVEDPALNKALINGTMFPDGGYAIGDGYGEIAHWEPLQNAYRDWIAQTYSAPWSDEASRHVAFLLGMASHGIADQTFDALFMERSKQEDAAGGWEENFDLATDVVMMSRVGARTPPEHWVPASSLVDIYTDQWDHTITRTDLEDAQELLRFAITSVGLFSEDAGLVDKYEAAFPWAATHLEDPDVPGSPPCEAALLASYWQSVWDRLHGELGGPPSVLATFPEDGAYGHPTDADTVQARISLVFSEALHLDSLLDSSIVLTDDAGRILPTAAWLFYRDMSHVVHLSPLEDLAEETWYTVSVGAGLQGIEGGVTEGGWAFRFSTAEPPQPDSGAEEALPGPGSDKRGCGCATAAPSGAVPLLVMIGIGIVWRRRGPGLSEAVMAQAMGVDRDHSGLEPVQSQSGHFWL